MCLENSKEGDGGWEKVTEGAMTKIEVQKGTIYGLSKEGEVWRHSSGKDDSSWFKVTNGGMVEFLLQGNQVYGLGSDKAIWKWQTTTPNNNKITTGLDSHVRTIMQLRKYNRRKLN